MYNRVLVVLFCLIVALGIFFRFANLGQKVYWYDETFTSLQLSGYSTTEIQEEIVTGENFSIEDLQKYQNPNSENTVVDTVKRIAKVEPQLTPLYFVLLYYWVNFFGDSIEIIRSFSAIMSLFAFPALYWLCWELFHSRLTGWIGISLIAVSPFHIMYAQEARPYALWTVTILVSCAAFLKAIRVNSISVWLIYGISIVVGLYSFLFTLLVMGAQGLYLLVKEKFRLTKTILNYVLTSFVSFALFIPWILLFLTGFEFGSESAFRNQEVSLLKYGIGWVRSLSLFFADFGLNEESSLIYLVPFGFFLIFILALSVYSIYIFTKNNPQEKWLFLLSLITIPSLALIIPDLLMGGQRALVTRYLIPVFLGLQIAVAFLFSIKAFKPENPAQNLWKATLTLLLSVSIFSCLVYTQSETWWIKADGNNHLQVSSIINQSQQPLVISDVWVVNMIALSHYLEPSVKVKLLDDNDSFNLAFSEFKSVFLYDSSPDLKADIEKKYLVKSTPNSLLLEVKSKREN